MNTHNEEARYKPFCVVFNKAFRMLRRRAKKRLQPPDALDIMFHTNHPMPLEKVQYQYERQLRIPDVNICSFSAALKQDDLMREAMKKANGSKKQRDRQKKRLQQQKWKHIALDENRAGSHLQGNFHPGEIRSAFEFKKHRKSKAIPKSGWKTTDKLETSEPIEVTMRFLEGDGTLVESETYKKMKGSKDATPQTSSTFHYYVPLPQLKTSQLIS